jgi:hypothetical protein
MANKNSFLKETDHRLKCEKVINGSSTYVSSDYRKRLNGSYWKYDWYFTWKCNDMDCGELWEDRADLIWDPNNKTGCSCIKNPAGFDVTKPGTHYVILFKPIYETEYVKLGITNNTVKERYSSEKQPYEILREKRFPSGQECWDYEQRLKKKFKAFKYIPVTKLKTGGNTECFRINVLNELKIEIPSIIIPSDITGDLTKFGVI